MVEMDAAQGRTAPVAHHNNANNAANNSNQDRQERSDYIYGVAHEFVRQYYTIMHKTPGFLHRFYMAESLLVGHGHLENEPQEKDKPYRGVEEITGRFSSLRSGEMFVKIRHVDALETVGNSIVVQVSGKLAQKGAVFRQFVQTFVLVRQGTNKYYVHNDIFRYQESEPLSSNNSEKDSVAPPAIEPVEEELPEPEPEEPEKEEEAPVEVEEPIVVEESIPEEPTPISEPEPISEPVVVENGHEESKSEQKESFENGPKSSYASMLSKRWSNIAAAAPVTPVELTPAPKVQAPPAPVAAPLAEVPNVDAGGDTPVAVPEKREETGNQRSKKPYNQNIRKSESKAENENGDDPMAAYSVDCHLFVGNLLPTITEKELGNIFCRFGEIIDIRIHRGNSNSKPGVKNYGFICFKSAEIVDKILAQKPLFFEGHRFNVERREPNSGRGGSGRKHDGPPRPYTGNPQRGGAPLSHGGAPRGNTNGNIPNGPFGGSNRSNPGPRNFGGPGGPMPHPRNNGHYGGGQNQNQNQGRSFQMGGKPANRV